MTEKSGAAAANASTLAAAVHSHAGGEVFERLAFLASVVVDFASAFVAFVDVEGRRVRACAGNGIADAESLAALESEVLRINDVVALPAVDALAADQSCAAEAVAAGIHAFVGVPIRSADGNPVGVLGVCDSAGRCVDAHRLEALRHLALQASAEVERRGRHAEFHYRMAILDLARTDLSDRRAAVRRIAEVAAEALDVSCVGVWFLTEDHSELVAEDVYTRPDSAHRGGERLTTREHPVYFRQLEDARTIAASDARRDPRTSELTGSYLDEHGVRSMLDVPIRSGGRVVGVVCHESLEPREWTSREQDFAGSVADLLATVVEASRRRETEDKLRALTATLESRVRERTAELERSNRALAEAVSDLESFCYSVSHDLRAPLRVINGFVSLLELDADSLLTEESRDATARIRSNTESMSRLIDALLGFSRLGRRPMVAEEVDMKTLAEEVARLLGLDRGGVELRVDDLPPARGDRRLLAEVFGNLLSNAVKFVDDGAVATVHVGSVRSARAQGDSSVYFVRDGGVGFDMRYTSKLFAPFQRLQAAQGKDGAGVGLAIVRRIVERHGGSVWAESAPGMGATFYFELPRDGCQDAGAVEELSLRLFDSYE